MNSITADTLKSVVVDLRESDYVSFDTLRIKTSTFDENAFLSNPIVNYIHFVERKITIFVQSYIYANSIVLLGDLEQLLVAYLRSYNIQSLDIIATSMSQPSTIDPNELDINENSVASITEDIVRFQELGFGHLHRHPILKQLFPDYTTTTQISPDHCTVLSLVDKILHPNNQHASFDSTDHLYHSITHALQELYQVQTLSSIGIHINQTNLYLLIDSLKAIHRERLAKFGQYATIQHNSYDLDQQQQQPTRQHESTSYQSIKPPTSNILREFIDDLRNTFHDESTDEEKISITKVTQKVQESLLHSMQSSTSQQQTSETNSKKRKANNNEGHANTHKKDKMDFMEQLVNAAAEYAFIHLASTSKAKRRIFGKPASSSSNNDNNNDINNSAPSIEVMIAASIKQASNASNDKVTTIITPFESTIRCTGSIQPLNPTTQQYSLIKRKLFTSTSLNNQFIEVIDNQEVKQIAREIHATFRMKEAFTHKDIGKFGELLVNKMLQYYTDDNMYSIRYMNDQEDLHTAFDLIITKEGGSNTKGSSNGSSSLEYLRQIFVEVKTSQFITKNVFEISLNEFEFAMKQPKVNFHIYRVLLGLNNNGRGEDSSNFNDLKIIIFKDLEALLRSNTLKLCLAYPT